MLVKTQIFEIPESSNYFVETHLKSTERNSKVQNIALEVSFWFSKTVRPEDNLVSFLQKNQRILARSHLLNLFITRIIDWEDPHS